MSLKKTTKRRSRPHAKCSVWLATSAEKFTKGRHLSTATPATEDKPNLSPFLQDKAADRRYKFRARLRQGRRQTVAHIFLSLTPLIRRPLKSLVYILKRTHLYLTRDTWQ